MAASTFFTIMRVRFLFPVAVNTKVWRPGIFPIHMALQAIQVFMCPVQDKECVLCSGAARWEEDIVRWYSS